MQTFVGLLRGINVGGHNKLPMAELRGLCQTIGLDDPKTYIQSGNLVFGSDLKAAEIAKKIENGIEDRFGFRPPVLLITKKELVDAAKAYPFSTEDHKLAHLMFLSDQPSEDAVLFVQNHDHDPDLIEFGERVIYFYLPNGVLGSSIDLSKLERITKVRCTSRNWRTVQKLVEMTS